MPVPRQLNCNSSSTQSKSNESVMAASFLRLLTVCGRSVHTSIENRLLWPGLPAILSEYTRTCICLHLTFEIRTRRVENMPTNFETKFWKQNFEPGFNFPTLHPWQHAVGFCLWAGIGKFCKLSPAMASAPTLTVLQIVHCEALRKRQRIFYSLFLFAFC